MNRYGLLIQEWNLLLVRLFHSGTPYNCSLEQTVQLS